jgi:hypothetical protein
MAPFLTLVKTALMSVCSFACSVLIGSSLYLTGFYRESVIYRATGRRTRVKWRVSSAREGVGEREIRIGGDKGEGDVERERLREKEMGARAMKREKDSERGKSG